MLTVDLPQAVRDPETGRYEVRIWCTDTETGEYTPADLPVEYAAVVSEALENAVELARYHNAGQRPGNPF